MTRFLKNCCMAMLLCTLAGCATTKSVADGAPVPAGDGVIVFHVDTQFPWVQLQYRFFTTKLTYGYFVAENLAGPDGAFYNKAGETYWVKPIKAGDYMWSQVLVDSRYANFHGSNRFTIKPGTITYVGHLTIEQRNGAAHIGVEDREQDMRDYLARNYPTYARTMSFEKSLTAFRF